MKTGDGTGPLENAASQAAEEVWQSGGVACNVSTVTLCRNIACYVSGWRQKIQDYTFICYQSLLDCGRSQSLGRTGGPRAYIGRNSRDFNAAVVSLQQSSTIFAPTGIVVGKRMECRDITSRCFGLFCLVCCS